MSIYTIILPTGKTISDIEFDAPLRAGFEISIDNEKFLVKKITVSVNTIKQGFLYSTSHCAHLEKPAEKPAKKIKPKKVIKACRGILRN